MTKDVKLMKPQEKGFRLRALVLICTPKLADKAERLLNKEKLPLIFRQYAVGTASSEMMDILGLGTIDKGLLICALPKCCADKTLKRLYTELRLAVPGSGIAFTLPLSGANAVIFKLLRPQAEGDLEKMADMAAQAEREGLPLEQYLKEGKGGSGIMNCKHMLIAAVVNQGYSESVMDAARSAGAGGGTVLHTRHISGGAAEGVMSHWGLTVQEEKEIILIIADADSKLGIMKAIGDACGMHTKAQGLVVSLPIDAAIGLGEEPDIAR